MTNTNALATEIETRCKHWRTLPPHPTDLLNAIKTWQGSADAKAADALASAERAAMGGKATDPDAQRLLGKFADYISGMQNETDPIAVRSELMAVAKIWRNYVVGNTTMMRGNPYAQTVDRLLKPGIIAKWGGFNSPKPYLRELLMSLRKAAQTKSVIGKSFGDFPRPDMPAVLDALGQAVKALRETPEVDEPYYRARTEDALKATRVGDAAKALPPVVQGLTDLIAQLRSIRRRLGGDENMKPYLQHVYNRFNDILHLDVRFQREVPTMYWGSAGGMLSKLAGDYIVYPQNAEKNLDAAVAALKRLVRFAVGYYNVRGKRDPNRSMKGANNAETLRQLQNANRLAGEAFALGNSESIRAVIRALNTIRTNDTEIKRSVQAAWELFLRASNEQNINVARVAVRVGIRRIADAISYLIN